MPVICNPFSVLITNFSILLDYFEHLITRSTKIPGKCISSDFNSPFSTISSTSATVIVEAPAISGLKFLAVFLKIRFPYLSALYAFIRLKSPLIAFS